MSNQNVKINFDTDRIYRNLQKAQKVLDATIVTDTEKYVPTQQGVLYKSAKTNTIYGSGEIIYGGTAVPYARYLYYGKVMVGKAPKKVIDKDLIFDKTAHENAQAKWFEKSKQENLDRWIDIVMQIMLR